MQDGHIFHQQPDTENHIAIIIRLITANGTLRSTSLTLFEVKERKYTQETDTEKREILQNH